MGILLLTLLWSRLIRPLTLSFTLLTVLANRPLPHYHENDKERPGFPYEGYP